MSTDPLRMTPKNLCLSLFQLRRRRIFPYWRCAGLSRRLDPCEHRTDSQ